jgi:LemA protein
MVQVRKVVRELYPDQFGLGRQPVEVPKRRFLRRFADKRLRQVGTHLGPMTRKRLFYALSLVLFTLTAWAFIYHYNKFIVLHANILAARSQIAVQLQRRKDIVASLNTVVVAYAKHEKGIFELAVDTRKELVHPAPGGPAKESQNSGLRLPIPGIGTDPAMSKLLAVAEGFPALRLSENFQRLMDALVEVETKIAEQRMLFNSRCNDMATALDMFPANVFNKVLRFKVEDFYTADNDVHEPAKLDLAPR